jgi:hypothetical protein
MYPYHFWDGSSPSIGVRQAGLLVGHTEQFADVLPLAGGFAGLGHPEHVGRLPSRWAYFAFNRS